MTFRQSTSSSTTIIFSDIGFARASSFPLDLVGDSLVKYTADAARGHRQHAERCPKRDAPLALDVRANLINQINDFAGSSRNVCKTRGNRDLQNLRARLCSDYRHLAIVAMRLHVENFHSHRFGVFADILFSHCASR